jgi:hypothetical protein
MGRKARPGGAAPQRRQQQQQQQPSWLAAQGVVALAVLAVGLGIIGTREEPKLDDRAALSAAEDLLASVSERAAALREHGAFFGPSYSELLPDVERAESMLLGMAEPDPRTLLASHRMAAHTAMSAGRLDASFAASTRIARQTYDPARPRATKPHEHHAEGRFSYPFTQRARLHHDAEQLDYLLALQAEQGNALPVEGLPARRVLTQGREGYRSVLAEIGPSPASSSDGDGGGGVAHGRSASERATATAMADTLQLSSAQWEVIQPWYNRAHFIPALPRQPGTVLAVSDADAAAAERAYLGSDPSLVVIDNLLTGSAIEAVREFAARATVWMDTKPGYVGAYLSSGWGTELMAQITEEIRQRFPAIICQHKLIEGTPATPACPCPLPLSLPLRLQDLPARNVTFRVFC